MSEINAAYLYAQLLASEKITRDRLSSWQYYYCGLEELKNKKLIELAIIPDNCTHNAHIFYIKLKDIEQRTMLMNYLKERDIYTTFHYQPLHTSIAGKNFSRFHGKDIYTTRESQRILRLPMYYGLKKSDIDYIIESINSFF